MQSVAHKWMIKVLPLTATPAISGQPAAWMISRVHFQAASHQSNGSYSVPPVWEIWARYDRLYRAGSSSRVVYRAALVDEVPMSIAKSAVIGIEHYNLL